jgi:hypothetical protein
MMHTISIMIVPGVSQGCALDGLVLDADSDLDQVVCFRPSTGRQAMGCLCAADRLSDFRHGVGSERTLTQLDARSVELQTIKL